MPAVRIETKHSILHSALSYKPTIGGAQFMNQCVCIDVIKSVAGRNAGRRTIKNSRDVRVLSVKVDYVGGKMALLEHVTGPRQVIDPRSGLLCPSVIAVEPLTKRSECQAGSFID